MTHSYGFRQRKLSNDNEFYHSGKKNLLQEKENYHETQTAAEMSTYFGFFLQAFRKVSGKKRNVIHQPRSVRIGKKLCALCQVPPLGTVFPNTDLPVDE